MGKLRKKGESGAATLYIARNQALTKLQLSLPDFRRLCILKGIYPVEPKNKKKVNKGSSANRTYYYVKDIQWLAHEPVLNKFREFKAFLKKLKKAIGKEEPGTADRLEQNKPVYTLDHIVKERYPTFIDAIRDLDDALSMVVLFSTLPQTDKVEGKVVKDCKRLYVEFQHYILASKSLRKVFFSIKGIYYQAEISGHPVTWITPHTFCQDMPADVDFRIMLTFIEFYTTLIGFVNFKLFNMVNLLYPPKLTTESTTDNNNSYCEESELETEGLAALSQSLLTVPKESGDDPTIDEFPLEAEADDEMAQKVKKEQESVERLLELFSECTIFLSREVPRESLVFIIRSFGGKVSWPSSMALGSTFEETDETITHHIIDRPLQGHRFLSRYYVQPQWIADSVNYRRLLPVEDYFPGVDLPPHLSPFVKEEEGDYIPPERQAMLEEMDEETRENDKEEAEQEEKPTMTKEEKNLAKMVMPKKNKRLLEKIEYSKRKKASQVKKLHEKRKAIDEQKSSKKIKTKH
ncbi:pescadillo homolog [Dendronephthya gigantea]|uniref:pescadillo homolog n=1 Tax=Dendronephthya gigantea TaxID=151771 RepID=UPI00106BA919|nr:pescadillo homolog [Dendronephthya gigantea]